jgi:hypothetical protein
MSIANFSVWFIGLMNGYKKDEDKLPNSIKYGSMGLTSVINMIKFTGSIKPPITNPGSILATMFLGVPLVTGSVFCLGNFLGKAVRYSSTPDKEKGTTITLF